MAEERERSASAQLDPEQRQAKFVGHLVAAKRVLKACATSRPMTPGRDDVEQWQATLSSQLIEAAAELRKAARLSKGQTTMPNGTTLDASAIERSVLSASEAGDSKEARKVARKAAKFIHRALSDPE